LEGMSLAPGKSWRSYNYCRYLGSVWLRAFWI